ncbi:MAG TPA: hypothetical protein VM821_07755 [Abditibacteriaceae bacterium]|nr:hypothetical protein [Abditibacteriaceae bacterium]
MPIKADAQNHLPALSAVLVTPDNFSTIRKTVAKLKQQTKREQIELVLVAPDAQTLDLPPGTADGFFSLHIVEVGPHRLIAFARAAGAKAARAPIIAYTEDHCFPEHDWAEKIIDAPWEEYAAVAPRFCNGNPRTAQSWADYFLNFGTWHEPGPSCEMTRLPWHNTAYKREVLLRHGDKLERMLEVEGELQNDMTQRGERLYLESAARVHHLNMSYLPSCAHELFNAGRLFGGTHAQKWNSFRRALYILLAPMVFVSRLRGQLAHLQRHTRANVESKMRVVHIGALMVLGSLLHIAGEAVGYARGVGATAKRKSDYESHRLRHLCRADRDIEDSSLRELDATP